MKVQKVKTDKLALNEDNPRYIREYKFEQLKTSLSEFTKMLDIRPIVVDKNYNVLGGNMRLKAAIALGFDEVPVQVVDLTEDEKREFVIKDNLAYGNWSYDDLDRMFDESVLAGWGMDLPNFEPDVDMSALEEETEADAEATEMEGGVMKSIQLEFEPEDYEAAFELYKELRAAGVYVGGLLMQVMTDEKSRLSKA